MQVSDYSALMLFLLIGVTVSVVISLLSSQFGPKNRTKQKAMPYESGSDPIGSPKQTRFSVKFYMIAISFILFDLETVFVIPWAVAWKQNDVMGHGLYAFGVMLIFVAVLTIGLVYEWKQGGLEWD
ncbi:MAG: NADH-quinone oxidoreductase subunit A [Myxococcota bacterium]